MDATNPVADADTPESTGAETQEVDEGFTETQTDDTGTPEQEPDEDEDFEVEEDLKIRVPKSVAEKLRLAALRQSDYTKKTQEVAEIRKATIAEREQLQQATGNELLAFAQAQNIGQQLQAYSQINWQAEMMAANANFDEDAKANIQAQFMQYQQLKDAHGQALGTLHNLRTQRLSVAQQETAKRTEEGRQVLVKEIPGWNDDHKAKLIGFAAEYGFTADELSDIEADPRQAKILQAAFDGTSAKRAATKLANLAKDKQVQPAKVLKGTSGASPIRADTKDFGAFERMANRQAAKA